MSIMANYMFLPLFVAHVVHGGSSFGWFVIIMVGGTIILYVIVALYEWTQKHQAIARISRLDLDPMKKYVYHEFRAMDDAINSMDDPAATAIGHVIRDYGLTEREYNNGQPTLIIADGLPPWDKSSYAVRMSLYTHRPDFLPAFDELSSKRRAVYTFFGNPVALFPTIRFPRQLGNNPAGRANAYWDHVHRLMTVSLASNELSQINETRRKLASDFSKIVQSYKEAYYRFIDAHERSESKPQSPPPPLLGPGECMCPTCHAKYKPADYQPDAPLWFCSSCKQPLSREG